MQYRHGATVRNRMIHLLILAVHLLTTMAKLVRPGGIRAVVAESGRTPGEKSGEPPPTGQVEPLALPARSPNLIALCGALGPVSEGRVPRLYRDNNAEAIDRFGCFLKAS